MKKKIIITVLTASSTIFSSHAFSSVAALDALENPVKIYSTPEKKVESSVPEIRRNLLQDAAKTVGYRAGLSARGKEIRDALYRREDTLNSLYDFSPLVSNSGVLPPVIVEANDVANYGDSQIRIANKAYAIKVDERFVSIPPTWKDYLFSGIPPSEQITLPRQEALPQSNAELSIWRDCARQGWQQGYKQADSILSYNFARINRDYNGMIRYSVLLQQGMVTLPEVVEGYKNVSLNNKEMVIGEKNRRLIEKSRFVADTDKRKGKLTSPDDNRKEPVQYKDRYQAIEEKEVRYEQYVEDGMAEKTQEFGVKKGKGIGVNKNETR